jgi:hypothetical protein
MLIVEYSEPAFAIEGAAIPEMSSKENPDTFAGAPGVVLGRPRKETCGITDRDDLA